LRKVAEGKEDTLTEAQAIEIIDTCMKVLFYRDARSLNKFHRAKVTAQGAEISGPFKAETEWGFGEWLRGYGP
jgi:20S proteasome subunit beta 7